MGPKRYEVSGAKTWISNKGYEGRISFTIDETNSTNPNDLEHRCLHRCPTCNEVSEILDNEDDNMAQNKKENGNDHVMDDTQPDVVTSRKMIEGQFMSITGAVMSCMSPKSPKGLTPSAHLGDGNLDLIVVNKTSRLNYLRYLIRTNKPSTSNSPFQLPFVTVYRVKEFSFEPKNQAVFNDETNQEASEPSSGLMNTSVWNCDGELISSPSIHAKVYCQILPVFARGIE
jgi:ceramide kinase